MTRTTDEELLAAVRAGEPHAFHDLRDRHWPTAVAVARLHTPSRPDAEQLAGTAVDQTLADLSADDAPEVFLRARLVEVAGRAGAEPPRAAEAVSGVYLGLPPSWQAVLWHTEVEGLPLDRTAELLGLSPAATTALHLEARAGLRAAYRRTKLDHPLTGACEECAGDLGAFVDGALPAPRLRAVEAHLDDCPRCTADLLHLQDTEAGLRGWVLPVLAGVPLWGDAVGDLGALVRAAGRESAGRPAAAPGADLAGGSLAAVGAARRGRKVLLGAGALAAAAALAGVAVTGPGGLGDGTTPAADTRAQEGGDGAATPVPSTPAAASGPAATEPGDSGSAPEAGGSDAAGPQADADGAEAEAEGPQVETEDTQTEGEDQQTEAEDQQAGAEDAPAGTEDRGDSGWPVRSGDVLVLEPSPVPARPAAEDADPADEVSTPARNPAPRPAGEGGGTASGSRGTGTTPPQDDPDRGAPDPAGQPAQDRATSSPGGLPGTPQDPPVRQPDASADPVGTPAQARSTGSPVTLPSLLPDPPDISPPTASSPPAPDSPLPGPIGGGTPDGGATPGGAATAPNG
ncbi:zf-HC2 domain-containing protein [Kocuria sp. CPCC 205300]|uniref:zf-HC2 domain-containing protein n=1 Tax=Kocuria sabuli TaxID=3071448 RepID=UPI0036DDE870